FQPLLRIFTKTIFTPEEPGALYKRYQLRANQTPIRMDKSDAWRSVAQNLELSAAKEAVKAMQNLQAIIQCKAHICFGKSTKDITTGETREKMFEFKIKKPEESSSNWKPWHKDWDAITSNHLEEDTINDDGKYRYNMKGFLEDDESSDDSILIVDPGWDDYCLQALNRPVPLCPEAHV
ncbi:hypothetical protein Tco_0253361, partial [Tanacetum coccineum]